MGSSVGSLRVYTADANVTQKTLLWDIKGPQSLNGMDWKQGVLPITDLNDDYVVVIEGTVGANGFTTDNGDIA